MLPPSIRRAESAISRRSWPFSEADLRIGRFYYARCTRLTSLRSRDEAKGLGVALPDLKRLSERCTGLVATHLAKSRRIIGAAAEAFGDHLSRSDAVLHWPGDART